MAKNGIMSVNAGRDAIIVAQHKAGTPNKEIAEKHGLEVARVQQILRVAKLREKHGPGRQQP